MPAGAAPRRPRCPAMTRSLTGESAGERVGMRARVHTLWPFRAVCTRQGGGAVAASAPPSHARAAAAHLGVLGGESARDEAIDRTAVVEEQRRRRAAVGAALAEEEGVSVRRRMLRHDGVVGVGEIAALQRERVDVPFEGACVGDVPPAKEHRAVQQRPLNHVRAPPRQVDIERADSVASTGRYNRQLQRGTTNGGKKQI